MHIKALANSHALAVEDGKPVILSGGGKKTVIEVTSPVLVRLHDRQSSYIQEMTFEPLRGGFDFHNGSSPYCKSVIEIYHG